jgi:ATP-dependent exoDNAse (exonuclease V) beta subunit
LPVVIDKDPDYEANSELTAWVVDVAKWCSDGEIYFHELVPFWNQLNMFAYGVHDERRRAELDQQLFDVLWNLRTGETSIHDWLKSLVETLDFKSLMKPYELIRPDDVAELRSLYSASGKSERLKRQTVREFSRLENKVLLTTIHGSKGLEFDAAIIVGLDAIRDSVSVPELKPRLAYVAVTRARTHLYILINQPTSPLAEKLAGQPEDVLKHWYCQDDGKLLHRP